MSSRDCIFFGYHGCDRKKIGKTEEVELTLVGSEVKELDAIGYSLSSFFGVERADAAESAQVNRNILKIVKLQTPVGSRLPVFEVHLKRVKPSEKALAVPAESVSNK